jgi:hypothetical protein
MARIVPVFRALMMPIRATFLVIVSLLWPPIHVHAADDPVLRDMLCVAREGAPLRV